MAIYFVLLSLMWFALYLLSVGPAAYIEAKSPAAVKDELSVVYRVLYEPLKWLDPLNDPLIWWIGLWLR